MTQTSTNQSNRPAPRRAPQGSSGFTMIELLVTMLLLAVVMLGLMALQVTTIRQVTSSRRANEATRLCTSVIERVRFAPYAEVHVMLPTLDAWDIPLNQHNAQMKMVAGDGIGAGPYTVQYFKESTASPPGLTITIRVSWQDVRPTSEKSDMTKKFQEFNVTMSCRRYQ